jgi:NAD(P)-dependent dehydrogenase (short-subunit alcohol dehydrogenase family)
MFKIPFSSSVDHDEGDLLLQPADLLLILIMMFDSQTKTELVSIHKGTTRTASDVLLVLLLLVVSLLDHIANVKAAALTSSSAANSIMTTATRSPTVLVTGSTDGIGLTTAKNMAASGYSVLLHGRSEQRLQQAETAVRSFMNDKQQRQKGGGGNGNGALDNATCNKIFRLPAADLSTVAGCMQLATDVKKLLRREQQNLRLSVLMNNAGVYSNKHVITADGTELTFAVNVVAPFVITSLLLPELLASSLSAAHRQEDQQQGNNDDESSPAMRRRKSRIVVASSISQCSSIRDWDDLHYNSKCGGGRPYSAHAAYSESKLLDAMLTMEMANRLKSNPRTANSITCNCLDPGTGT